MSRQVQQNVLNVTPAGGVGAVFPGGVELPQQATAALTTPPPGGAIRWVRQADGSIPGSKGGLTGFMVGESDNPTFRNGLVAIVAVDPSKPSTGRASIYASASTLPTPFSSVGVQFSDPSASKLIYEANSGKSGWVQVPTSTQLSMQVLAGVFTCPAGGVTSATFSLPTPWNSAHYGVQATITAAPLGAWGIAAAAPAGLNQVIVYIYNNPGIQDYTIFFTSYGF